MTHQTDSRKVTGRVKAEHFLINTSLWGIYALSGLLLGIAILLSSCVVTPLPAASAPGPVYYQPYYATPYYYPRYYYYGPRYGYYGYGCRWHCW